MEWLDLIFFSLHTQHTSVNIVHFQPVIATVVYWCLWVWKKNIFFFAFSNTLVCEWESIRFWVWKGKLLTEMSSVHSIFSHHESRRSINLKIRSFQHFLLMKFNCSNSTRPCSQTELMFGMFCLFFQVNSLSNCIVMINATWKARKTFDFSM